MQGVELCYTLSYTPVHKVFVYMCVRFGAGVSDLFLFCKYITNEKYPYWAMFTHLY